ncbi:MAG: BadF/BadG/BcrA/BcrD ATPase family protein, partial [Micromonosporaceae bacterium]
MVVDGGRLVLGGDVGGTSTRIVVADETGRILATARSRGANPTVEPRMAAETLRGAVEDALRQVPGARIEVAVIGMAGGGALDDGDVRDAFATAWRSTGIGCRPEAVADVEVAFASGTAASDGTVLIAGTGAAAGAIRDRAVHH